MQAASAESRIVNEKDLAEACRRGEEGAYKELYDTFSHSLYGVCRRYMGNSQDADDVFQDGFISIISKEILWMAIWHIHTLLNIMTKSDSLMSLDIEEKLLAPIITEISKWTCIPPCILIRHSC